MTAKLVLVAHGTRNPDGLATIAEIASAAADQLGAVHTAFVDVLGPNPRELLADSSAPAVVVPAFLASGYHVNTDLPARVRESGHRGVTITPALGPDPVLAEVMVARLREVGWRPGDAVVMGAAGSSDPTAQQEVRQATALLAERVGEVELGFVATGAPSVADVVSGVRGRSRGQVFIASYLLAPGFFHTKLGRCGADAVADPLGAHPDLVGLLVRRFNEGAGVEVSGRSGGFRINRGWATPDALLR